MCEHSHIAELDLGEKIANTLMLRISDIMAADNIEDLLLGKPRIENNEFILNLNDTDFLVFIPNHPVTFKKKSLEWCLVSRVKLIKIGSYI
jgi:hypothetical protein